ncbi:geranylgeranylglyceryl/heptaprenylglyceryl phosphate synthase [Leeuwenhoekiella sp. MAR_2009_132]|uniref:geranylgeranylglyceryl/heptaprenylglyceryl phosphate synthase n=1 Tax=Leeuwenhoekiella sp. MAR_2009_132 TaxID=1392489 RepID=UPI00048C47A7|nr:geranylgeranylglyceryl/heptaprenylglyceryl phosphate synthase [Leeuwenhoekiella sp. MAR_2009_132]
MIKNLKKSKKEVYTHFLNAAQNRQSLFAILFDPEEFDGKAIENQLKRIPKNTTHILVGGSTATQSQTQVAVRYIKEQCKLPVVLFPGDYRHITAEADALLFLSLLSGDNAEYLIHQQIKSVDILRDTDIEIIPTGYILIDGGIETAVQRVSNTQPLSQNNIDLIVNTALAGQYTGKKLIYLEAGSGAVNRVSVQIIEAVKKAIAIPLIVGGGIRTQQQLQDAYRAGADMIVVGNAFEKGDF